MAFWDSSSCRYGWILFTKDNCLSTIENKHYKTTIVTFKFNWLHFRVDNLESLSLFKFHENTNNIELIKVFFLSDGFIKKCKKYILYFVARQQLLFLLTIRTWILKKLFNIRDFNHNWNKWAGSVVLLRKYFLIILLMPV